MLSQKNLPLTRPNLTVPEQALFNLPEKVLQFGTGVLLRGLPDYYIDKANRQGVFNGRIAVVKSTPGPVDDFTRQDNLYTIHVRGIKNGQGVDENIICSSISRVLSADNQWNEILGIAQSKHLQVVISNTTEVGIQLVEEPVTGPQAPASYPGKLLAVLLERFKTFGNDSSAGLVIIPTELLTDNGLLLKDIVLKLAAFNNLDEAFINWLITANYFCNSLVDRIVPGKPDAALNDSLNTTLGYQDDLRIVAEPYSLWAIQGGKEVADVLTFSTLDEGVKITPDIEKFKELKLRLLNGTHSLSCALAVLCGFTTVEEAMRHADFLAFIKRLMNDEIAPAIPYQVDTTELKQFAGNVVDRFSNPNIKHQWLSISLQYSLKLRSRVVPLLINYTALNHSAPGAMAVGFAAFIRFMKIIQTGAVFEGDYNGKKYTVTDNNAAIFSEAWKNASYQDAATAILQNEQLWGTDLTLLRGFKDMVLQNLYEIEAGKVSELLIT